ncbi:Protein MICROTUBULE ORGANIZATION 1 [Trifolium repens]|nr:Protein MICROTUBULE ORGANIZATION 1 [Trifolium repens]
MLSTSDSWTSLQREISSRFPWLAVLPPSLSTVESTTLPIARPTAVTPSPSTAKSLAPSNLSELMATSNSMSMHLTEHEVLLVRQFLSNNEGFFHLGACGRRDEHAAFEVLARLIRLLQLARSSSLVIFLVLSGDGSMIATKIVMATSFLIGNVASAMGQAVEKSSKGILLDLLKCLGDNKKHMRECVPSTLDSWLAAVHLDKMFSKSNTTCLLKMLEFLPPQLDTLKDDEYSLKESEVAIFLPCLVEKV